MSSNVMKNVLLIGQCLVHQVENATKVRVNKPEFDSFLKMYFNKYIDFHAYDPKKMCKEGDIVLIRKRPEFLTRDISHDVVKILYPFGDVTDPITGEKCVGANYRTTMKLEKELYEKAEDGGEGFDYESAPDRGWQEGRKDFTHKVGYQKFHEFEPGHPMHDDPSAS